MGCRELLERHGTIDAFAGVDTFALEAAVADAENAAREEKEMERARA